MTTISALLSMLIKFIGAHPDGRIEMTIHSNGGSIISARYFFNTMTDVLNDYTCFKFITIAERCESAAVILFLTPKSMDDRFLRGLGWIMNHACTTEINGSTPQIHLALRESTKTTELIKNIVCSRTCMPKDVMDDAQRSLEGHTLNICDAINYGYGTYIPDGDPIP